jgi:hypothetical protein
MWLDVKSKSERGYDLAERKVNVPEKAFDARGESNMPSTINLYQIGAIKVKARAAVI